MHLSEDLVQAHLDGELSEGQEKVCVQHLQHCASCHEKFEALQNRGNANRSRLDALLPAEKAPHPDVLLKRIQTERETEGSRVFQWKPAWAAAVGFAALIAAFAF
ncbi:MAG TPA: zf-HC2 domain-containing protein [Acidobacteriota bacterium]